MKVLIVEDEILIAMDSETLVKALGHQVVGIATSASEAVSQAATHRPDVALMDIRLSGGRDGEEAACEMHARQGLRCIFLSANLDEATSAAPRTPKGVAQGLGRTETKRQSLTGPAANLSIPHATGRTSGSVELLP